MEEWESSALDGEAYYLAREAIVSIGNKKGNMICFNTKSKYDKYVNVLCSSSMKVKSMQSQVAHIIELLADIMAPIVFEESDAGFYESLMEDRVRVIEQEKWNKVSTRYRDAELLNINYGLLFKKERRGASKNENELNFVMDEFWVHGMSTEIAQVMNTTRQNVDRYISLGKIKESRTTDKAIYELLGEDLW